MLIKRLYWFIAVLMGLILVACGETDDPTPMPSPPRNPRCGAA